jgi:hypothetical protein
MVDAGLAVRRGRAFVEAELRTALRLLERLLEYVVLTPKLQHLFLKGWSVVATCHFFKCQNSILRNQKRPGNQVPDTIIRQEYGVRYLISGANEFIAVPPGFAAQAASWVYRPDIRIVDHAAKPTQRAFRLATPG